MADRRDRSAQGKTCRRRARRFLLGLAAGLWCGAAAAQTCDLAEAPSARVDTVPDARTVALADGRKLRPAGIETFALLSPGDPHVEAPVLTRMRALMEGMEVRLRAVGRKPDRYGRVPALIALPDGRLLTEELAAEGLAIAFSEDDGLPCFAPLLAAEAEARRAGRGHWSGDLAQLPAARPKALAGPAGRFAIFQGKVISVGTRKWRTYLNFGYRWSEDVTVTIEARDRERFGGDAGLERLAGRRVRVRGFLDTRSGPTMTIRSPNQLEIAPDRPEVVQEKP